MVADALVAGGVLFEILFARWALHRGTELQQRTEKLLALATERAAEANTRSAEAQKEAEALRANNLSLWRMLQPRRIITFSRNGDQDIRERRIEAVREFEGALALVQSVPDFEAQKLAAEIRHMLASRCGWKPMKHGVFRSA